MKYIIYGDPIPLARPRFKNQTVYDSQSELKLIASINLASQHGNNSPYDRPLHLETNFFMRIPRKYLRRKLDFRPHQVRPDLDNLLKWVCDILQKAEIVKDDKLIWSMHATKQYDTEPRTEIIITEFEYV